MYIFFFQYLVFHQCLDQVLILKTGLSRPQMQMESFSLPVTEPMHGVYRVPRQGIHHWYQQEYVLTVISCQWTAKQFLRLGSG
jgi:hypothetical protein